MATVRLAGGLLGAISKLASQAAKKAVSSMPSTPRPSSTPSYSRPSSSSSSSSSSRGLTAAQQAEIERLGNLWQRAQTDDLRNIINQQANQIRQSAGLRPGIDYDPQSGQALRTGVYNNSSRYGYSAPATNTTRTTPNTPIPTFGSTGQTPTMSGLLSLGLSAFLPSSLSRAVGTAMGAAENRIANNIASNGGSITSVDQAPTEQPMNEQLLQMIQDLLSQQGLANQQMMEQWQNQARQQAEAIAQQRMDGLNTLIDQLKSSQQSGLMGIANGLEDAKMGVEDRTFQNWLAARQAMSNRGLAGSGLASDQDTRLLLQKQRDLAGVYRDANQARYDLQSRIGSQLDSAYKQLAGVNEDDIYADQFNQIYQQGRSALTDQAKIYADLFKSILPYERATMGDLLNNQLDWAKLAQEARNNLSNLDMRQQELALEQAKLLMDQQRIDLDYWETYGYMPDPNGSGKLVPTAATTRAEREAALAEAKARGYFIGQDGSIIPTEERRSNEATENLRGQELVAQVNQWAVQNQLSAGRLDLDAQQFSHKMEMDQEAINQFQAQLAHEEDKTQLDWIKAQLSGIDSQIRAEISADGTPTAEIVSKRNALIRSAANIFNDAQKKSSAGINRSVFERYLPQRYLQN